MGIETVTCENMPIFEALEPRLLLSTTFDLDGDTFVGAGDDAIFDPAWHAEGGYAFSDSMIPPADTPGWNHLADFDGDFHVGSGDYAWLSSNWGKYANDPSIVLPTDPHDSDESMAQADAQGVFTEDMWFSEQYGKMAIANDGDDYFRIDVSSSDPVVTIDCRHEYASGDIDIELLDSTGVQVASSAYTVDNESIEAALPSGGAYYIRVFSPNGASGQRYDLWWRGQAPTDYHEEDDNEFDAPAHGNFPQNTWYSDIYGVPGVQADVDTFMIDVPAGQRLVTVDCTFSHADGNIDMYVVDNFAQIVGYSSTWDDNEHIEFLFEEPGTHFIQLIGDSIGTTYDLLWFAQDTPLQAVEDTAVIDEDSADNFVDVLSNDLGEGLVITAVGGGWTDGNFAYITPPVNYSGFSYFSYQIQESGGITDWGRIAVTINPLPDDPVAVNDIESLPEGSVDYIIDVLDNDSDPDGDVLTIDSVVVLGGEPRGTVWTDGDYVYYTVLIAGTGTDTLEYTVSDGTGRTDTATVEVAIFTGLTPPVALDDDGTAIESHTVNVVNVMGNDYDPDLQAIQIVDIPRQGDHGTASFDGLMVNYEADEGYRGPDSFEYTIEDTTGRQATATVHMFVLPYSDIHEEDDNFAQADMQGVAPHMVAPCNLLDEDYYMIEIAEGSADRVTAELWAEPDTDMELLDANGVLVASSFNAPEPSNDKLIDTTSVSPGKYYIRVFSPTVYWGQGYVIQWDSFGPGDPHEPDDTFGQSDTLGSMPPGPNITGFYNNDDYYRFEVQPGQEYVQIRCTYHVNAPDLDVAVYDDVGSLLGAAEGEHYRAIFADLLPAGTYYAQVYAPGGPTGQAYMINWEEGPSDDSHEDDDTIAQAADKEWLWPDHWFSQMLNRNAAVNFDDDFIEINVRRGFERVNVNCTFDHTEGDIDIYLLDATGNPIASSVGHSGTEIINTVAPVAGDYYIRVTNPGGATGQFYNLIWFDSEYDDAHETDDYTHQATDKGATQEEVWIDGRARDRDYYQIVVPQGYLHATAILEFLQTEGDLDLELRSETGVVLASSKTGSDNEFIGCSVDSPGAYFIRIIAAGDAYTGQDYRLWWRATLTDDPHEEDDDWTSADAQGDLPETSPYQGTMWDEDVYRLDVPVGQEHISITCQFDPSLGDLDLYLVDDMLTPVEAATGTADSAFIETTLASAGTYYVMVYDPAIIYSGMPYTLTWTAAENDDSHESDDTRAQADAVAPLDENTWFHGRQLDADYFKVTVPFQQQYFEAQCLFDSGEGPIQMKLKDEHGEVVATGRNEPGGMVLRTVFPMQTTKDYYLEVWTFDGATGQYYDLKWSASEDDWHEEDDDMAFAYFKGATEQNVEHSGVIWDQDVWRLDVAAGRETILIDFEDSSCRLSFELYDATGHLVEANGWADYRDRGQIHVSVDEAGSYYLRISQYSGVFGDEFETGETYSFTWRDAPSAEYDWTILWYAAADNNLDPWIGDDLRDAMGVAPVSNVALTWLYDGYDSDGYASLGRTLMKGPDTGEISMGERDTSSHESLQAYMEWGVEHYPAKNYLLIIDDHGATFNGVCTDDTNGTGIIHPWELADVIESVHHMDLILFKTCRSLNIEMAYELRNAADYIVGHESLGWSGRWNMSEMIEYVYDDPSRTAEQIANKMVTEYYEDNKDPWPWESHMEDVVMAAVNTSHVAALAASMDAFAQTVIADATPSDWAWLDTYRGLARSWDPMVDIGSFMMWVAGGGAEVTASIRSAAEAVQIERAQTCYHYAWLGKSMAMGLSVYYPNPTTPRLRWEYDFRHLEIATDWNWTEMFLVDDDTHEQDDAHWLANEQDALDAGVFFDGISWDDDYFRIYVPEGQEHVQIVCNFSSSEGDINLYLLDDRGKQIAAAESTTANESIDFTVPKHGLHYIRVAADEDPIGQDYAVRWLNSTPATAPGAASEPVGAISKIDVELVVLLDESGIDTSPTLPLGLTEVYEYMPFVVEVWVKNIDASPNGITGGYFGMMYDYWAVSAQSVHTGGVYTSFGDSAMSFGQVDSMGGQAPLGALSYGDDEWVRLGYVEFMADAADLCYLSPMSGDDSFARAYEGAIDPVDLEFDDFVGIDIVEGPPMALVDLQSDSDTGASDTDNVTNDNTPTFDVTVNYGGTVRIDYDDDDDWDEERPVFEPGTYEFTPAGPLPDGDYPVVVEFEVSGLGTDSDTLDITVDTVGPQVVQVFAASTFWSQKYFDDALGGAPGWALPDGADQLKPMPWNNLDQLKIVLDEDVVVADGDLVVHGVNSPSHVTDAGGFGYVAASRMATWKLATMVSQPDKLLLVLSDGVTDVSGNAMDGEWTNGADAYNSGDNAPGGDFQFRFNVLPGNSNRDEVTNLADRDGIRTRMFVWAGQEAVGEKDAYSEFYDLNGSGRVDFLDWSVVLANRGALLPVDDPVAPVVAAGQGAALAAGASGEILTVNASVTPPVVPIVTLPPEDDDSDDSIAAVLPAPAVDLLHVESPSAAGYISGPQAISVGLPATTLYRAATGEYDLRPLGDDIASDASGDDLLVDVLAESALAGVL